MLRTVKRLFKSLIRVFYESLFGSSKGLFSVKSLKKKKKKKKKKETLRKGNWYVKKTGT